MWLLWSNYFLKFILDIHLIHRKYLLVLFNLYTKCTLHKWNSSNRYNIQRRLFFVVFCFCERSILFTPRFRFWLAEIESKSAPCGSPAFPLVYDILWAFSNIFLVPHISDFRSLFYCAVTPFVPHMHVFDRDMRKTICGIYFFYVWNFYLLNFLVHLRIYI